MIDLLRICVSLPPVFAFLAGLVFLDSFKLVSVRMIVQTILIGCVAAVVLMFLNGPIQRVCGMEIQTFSRYLAPVLEELLKAVPLIYLISRKRLGFMVDAAICGFAVGAGFAVIENIYYLRSLEEANILAWIIRGFGTAVMHGGTTAIFAVLAKNRSDRYARGGFHVFLPGLLIAIAIHSFFNHFFLLPHVYTIAQLIVLPVLVVITFTQSERILRNWLEVGLDSDVQLLSYVTTGTISTTRIGEYLTSLQARFPGEIVADMLCFLRVHLELAVRAKGILLMREAGFRVPADPETKARLTELKFLEKSIGKTGQLAMAPFLHTSSHDLWQLYLLEEK
ncbi:MAG: PrsW family glutamic-type intramembrane protease [Candidatus Eisenbacteria bacterium]